MTRQWILFFCLFVLSFSLVSMERKDLDQAIGFADHLFKERDYDRALGKYVQILSLIKDQAIEDPELIFKIYYRIAKCWFELEYYDEVEAFLEPAMKIRQDVIEAHFMRIVCQIYELPNKRDQLKFWKSCFYILKHSENQEHHYDVYLYQGRWFLDNKQFDRALKKAQKAYDLFQNKKKAPYLFVDIYLAMAENSKKGDAGYISSYKKIVFWIKVLMDLKDQKPSLFCTLIKACYFLGEYEAALEAVERAIKMYPEEITFYLLKSRIFEKMKRFQEAVDFLEKSKKFFPNRKWALFILANKIRQLKKK